MDHHYMDHYCKVRNARCIIDARPPLFNAGTFLRPTSMRIDNETSKQIISDNVLLLEKLNRIQRIEGEVKCYNKNVIVRKTKIPDIKKWLSHIDEENYTLGQKLLCMKGTMNTTRPNDGKYVLKTRIYTLDKKELYKKYHHLMPTSDVNIFPSLLWPRIYLDLEIKDVRPLDRIVLGLCTETAPQVVIQLVRMCKEGKNLIKFNRIYPNLWIEGEIKIQDENALPSEKLPLITSCIDHGQSGTLNLLERGSKDSYEFSLSFKPLKVLNGRSIAFGKVLVGQKVLNGLQDYGTKNGKPRREIIVNRCGLVK